MYTKPSDIIKKGESTVTMLFPSKIHLNLGGQIVEFDEGVHEVPASLAGHWYLKAHGVKAYSRPQYPPPKPFTATQAHLDFLQKAGAQGLESLADVQKLVLGLSLADREAFMTDFAEFEKEGEKEPAPDLSKMTKDQLVTHGAEAHGLELDPKDKKENLIAAITEAAKKKE